jgi:transcriptional regulator with XRE-family HTH domain
MGRTPQPPESPEPAIIGAALKAARLGAGIKTLEDMASKAQQAGMDGLTSALLSSYENGRHVPHKNRFCRLLKICGATITSEAEQAYQILIARKPQYGQLASGKRQRVAIDHRRFIQVWQEASTPADVVAQTGMTWMQALQKANYLRSHHVRLKELRRTMNPKKWDELRNYAESLLLPEKERTEE